VKALSKFGFSELRLGRIEIVVAVGNDASISVARKSGALQEGLARNRLKIHEKFSDAHVFSLVPGVDV
jgi:ribosomal-protein-serine acetyltransferase